MVALVAVYTGRNSWITYGVSAGIFPGEVARVSHVSLARADIRYQFVICEGSVDPNPIRAPIATLFVAKSVPVPVSAVPVVCTVQVLSFFTSIVKLRTVCAVAVARVIVINHFQLRAPVFRLSSQSAIRLVAVAPVEFSTAKI